MKKAVSLILSVIFILGAFCSCGKDTAAWKNANDTFKDIVVYKYGDTISADYASTCSIKIEDNSYKHFEKYINDLKRAGFEFYPGSSSAPENISLNNGQANWRGSNGKIYLQLIFNETGSALYGMFGCNVQIYGYGTLPPSWGVSPTKNHKDETTTEPDTSEETSTTRASSADTTSATRAASADTTRATRAASTDTTRATRAASANTTRATRAASANTTAVTR